MQFYREFPQELRTAQAALGTDYLEFDLWKPVGDELIFRCDVQSEKEIHDALCTWIETMTSYKQRSLDDTSMGTKGGAFIATFPGPDSRSTIPRRPQSEESGRDVVVLNQEAIESEIDHDRLLYDYFGPSIDTGFRVLSKCTDRHFSMSVEVAFALSCFDASPDPQSKYTLPPIVLLHSDGLKGVWSDRRYPVFALDLEHTSSVNVAYAPFDRPETGKHQVMALCEACYTDAEWPFRMYLPGSTNEHFLTKPLSPLARYLEGIEHESAGEELNSVDEGGVEADSSSLPMPGEEEEGR